MGNCTTGDFENRRAFCNSFLEIYPQRLFSENSSLQYDVHTWNNRNLPNFRYIKEMTTKSLSTNSEGRIIFNSKMNSILFRSSQTGDSEPLPESYNYNLHPTNVISLQVLKAANGFNIKFLNEPGYELLTTEKQMDLGDTFFIGGLEYEIINFVTDLKYVANKLDDSLGTGDSTDEGSDPKIMQTTRNIFIQQHFESQKPACRICLGSEAYEENPFVSPCDCTGSVKFCHLQCWKTWILSSETSKEGFYIGNLLKQKCEICKKDLLADPAQREKVTSFLSLNAQIKPPYVVLEAKQPVSNYVYFKKNTPKLGYIFISFDGKTQMNMGKSTEAGMPFTIQSGNVMRNACLEFKEGKLYLKDQASKYGTFIKREELITINDGVPRHFLYKNNIISLKVE